MTIGDSSTRIPFDRAERVRSLRREPDVASLGLNQLTLQPGQRGRIHRHREQEEISLVLTGRLTILREREPQELRAGELARLDPGLRRRLADLGEEPCVVVAIGAAGGFVGRDAEACAGWSERDGRPPQEVPLPDHLARR